MARCVARGLVVMSHVEPDEDLESTTWCFRCSVRGWPLRDSGWSKNRAIAQATFGCSTARRVSNWRVSEFATPREYPLDVVRGEDGSSFKIRPPR